MKTLVVYFSKTGNTRKVKDKIAAAITCDTDEILFDDKAHTVKTEADPSDYDTVILMGPIWAFHLPEPLKLYLKENGAKIKNYRLLFTCAGLGLNGCEKGAEKLIGKAPEAAAKIVSAQIRKDEIDISEIIKGL